MKKRITIILAIVLILGCLLVLTSCDKTEAATDTTLVDAYNLAVKEGFDGTQEEWLLSLTSGKSAYEIAVDNGFAGTEADWLASLKGVNGQDGEDGQDGTSGFDGKDGKNGTVSDISALYEKSVEEGYQGTFLEFVSSLNLELAGEDTEYVANKAMRSVVSINTYFTEKEYDFFGNVTGETTSAAYAGSGVIYSLDKENGNAYIITNYHVVYSLNSVTEDKICEDIRIKTYGSEYSDYEIKTEEGGATVEYIGGAMNYDIAIIKISNSDFLKTAPLLEVEVDDSPYIDIGSTAVVVGNPSGSGLSSTSGIISVDSEYITMNSLDGAYEVVDGKYVQKALNYRVLRLDAPINGGNSGGGLFNGNGELIGIVNAKCVQTNIDNVGYAIPAHNAISVADNLIANYESGNTDKSLKRVLIGVSATSDSSKGVYDEETGTMKIVETVVVSALATKTVEGEEETEVVVDETSAAYRNGIQVNDILASVVIDGETIVLDREYILREELLKLGVGDTITLNIIRDGEEKQIEITFEEGDLQEVS